MKPTSMTRNQARRCREGGASVVEAALVAPLFLFLILGIIELSVYLFDLNGMKNGARQAARVASASGSDAYADYDSLMAAKTTLSSSTSAIEAVIVYKATKPSDPLPPQCLAELSVGHSGVDDLCNIYTSTQLQTATRTDFGWTIGSNEVPTLWDRFWAPTGRNDAITEDAEPDFVGVWVRSRHSSLTGLIPARTITGTSVFRIEPQKAL